MKLLSGQFDNNGSSGYDDGGIRRSSEEYRTATIASPPSFSSRGEDEEEEEKTNGMNRQASVKISEIAAMAKSGSAENEKERPKKTNPDPTNHGRLAINGKNHLSTDIGCSAGLAD